MIIKSFFRKSTTKIYFLVFIIIFLSIFILNLIIKQLDKINVKNFMDSSFVYVNCKNECIEVLKDSKGLTNVKNAILFDNIVIENEFLEENFLKIYDIEEKILGFSTGSYDLNVGEIIIGLKELEYKNLELQKDKIIGSIITLTLETEQHNFIIKDIVNSNRHSKVFVSTKFVDKNSKKNYIYTANLIKKNDEKKILNELYRKIDGDVIFINDYQNSDIEIREKLQEYILTLKLVNYVIIFVLFVITMITNKNMMYDFRNNANLEYKLGYSKFNIKKNTFKKIFLLHFSSLFISILFSLIFVSFRHNLYLLINVFLILLIYLLINDLIISLKFIL